MPPSGYSVSNTDCDDTVATGTTRHQTFTFYADSDGDGFGTSTGTALCAASASTVPSGYSTDNTDCADTGSGAGNRYPGATEVTADEVDQNCDDGEVCYYDADNDDYGTSAGTTTTSGDSDCDDALESVFNSDCDDASSLTFPGAAERDSATACMKDTDTDGYGATSGSIPTGVTAGTDCNDFNSTVNPGATDGVEEPDLDCDGFRYDPDDDGIDYLADCDDTSADLTLSTGTTYYLDADADRYGSATTSTTTCGAGPAGYVTDATDCDDAVAATFPGATETCNSADDDCDGVADDGIATTRWYRDADSDAFGVAATFTDTCAQPSGYVADGTDCVDTNATINPGATETCDGVDQDCDGTADDGVTTRTWYLDTDRDDFGDDKAATNRTSCSDPSSGATIYSSVGTDCNDAAASVYPGAPEVCDGIDYNCDGSTGYADADLDSATACGGDCDDTNVAINPSASEVCDGNVDNNCDGFADDRDANTTDASKTMWYADTDGDGYGNGTGVFACTQPTGYVGNTADCDDTNVSVKPGVLELCDGIDNDCDRTVDTTGAVGAPTWYADLDGDGFGDPYATQVACSQPAGYVAIANDCDDAEPLAYPGATVEYCDGIFSDCDDDAVSPYDAPANELDADGDGYVSCAWDPADTSMVWRSATLPEPTGGDDCDDSDPSVLPGATVEYCDGVYSDCDLRGSSTAAPSDETDNDSDGFVECTIVSAWLGALEPIGDGDCDDASNSVYPGAIERCNGIDEDCSGTPAPNEGDNDGDGFVACDGWTGAAGLAGSDCEDLDSFVYPGADAVCDGQFNDCDDVDYTDDSAPSDERDDDEDGFVECLRDRDVPWNYFEEGALAEDDLCELSLDLCVDCDDADDRTYPGASGEESGALADECTTDADGDGWGDEEPAPGVVAGTDCDDGTLLVAPDMPETCESGLQVDNDCDGSWNTEGGVAISDGTLVLYPDNDGDTFGAGTALPACADGSGYSRFASDCDDTDILVYPNAPEICNEIDDDCDGATDEPEGLDPSANCEELFRDIDEDGYGDVNERLCLCDPDGNGEALAYGDYYVQASGDCDDYDANTRPRGCEDGVDNDADGATDAVDPDCQAGNDEALGGAPADWSEIIDGDDNDCDSYVPAIELDCDDDGSFPALPIAGTNPLFAAEVGLAACEPGTARVLSCWDTTLDLVCRTPNASTGQDFGFWMLRYDVSDDGWGGRYVGGRRVYETPTDCDQQEDCDDQCATRCPGVDEVCDGADNDCSDTEALDGGGIPNTLETEVGVPGTIPATERDQDSDGYYACDTFRPDSQQTQLTSGLVCPAPIDADAGNDCNDVCSISFPGATEVCNGLTDACDAAAEGTDGDYDGASTCGAWSLPGGDEMAEDVYLVAWIEDSVGGDTADTADTSDTSATGRAARVVPLLLPRPLAPECDAPLDEALRSLLPSPDDLDEAIASRDATALLAACEADNGGQCAVIRISLRADADEETSPSDGASPFEAACEERPEQYITRTVWSAERILEARRSAVEFESRRVYSRDASAVLDSTAMLLTDIRSPASDVNVASETRWWMEMGRYSPEVMTEGTVVGCWGPPADVASTEWTDLADGSWSDGTGGDCDDGRGGANRGLPEGPADLVGIYLGTPADCAQCLDGVDNNCDGSIDCEDASCAPCFVGDGLGCADPESPCVGAGCGTAVGDQGRASSALGLLGVMLAAGLGRRRTKR